MKGLIEGFVWEVIANPLDSSDIAPIDFHLFPKLKDHLDDQQFETDDELQDGKS